MLAIPQASMLSVPIFSFKKITEKISSAVENQVISFVKIMREDAKLFYDLAYIKNETITLDDMEEIEELEDFLLWYSDALSKLVEDEENQSYPLYQHIDELYTLTLKITTSISYIRSKNRQLINVA